MPEVPPEWRAAISGSGVEIGGAFSVLTARPDIRQPTESARLAARVPRRNCAVQITHHLLLAPARCDPEVR